MKQKSEEARLSMDQNNELKKKTCSEALVRLMIEVNDITYKTQIHPI